ncbi:MAG: hypothetical protein GQE15_11600 [Archangiaceae bacterium]|nr:hypothetical protein [Archangiaceae bacterium]
MPLLALVTTLVLVDIPPPPECTRDNQCVLTTFAGCCGACCPKVRAIPKGKDEQSECKTMNCAPPTCTTECTAPGVTQYVAACVARQCEAVRKDAECRVADDCVLVEDAAPPKTKCSKDSCCCPVMVAVPRSAKAPATVPKGARCESCPNQPYSYPNCIEGRCQSVISRPKKKL